MLFATIAAGGGHLATASAMAESVAAHAAVAAHPAGSVTVRVSEVMPELGFAALDRRHKSSWRGLLERPRLVRWAQRAMDSAPALARAAQDLLLDAFAKSAAAHYLAHPPSLIVVNHGWLATAFTRATVRYGLAVPVVVYATEPFDASALWSTPAAQTVLAPSTAAVQSLVNVGVPRTALTVAGYPVAARFLSAPAQTEARARLGLPEGFTCLISLGAEGVVGSEFVGAIEQLARRGVQTLCMCGRNARLKETLEALAARLEGAPDGGRAGGTGNGVPPRVFGYVADMETYLAACDVVLGKAGPASTMEALAVGRPVIATSYAGLNELAVGHYLAASGQGQLCLDLGTLPDVVEAWRPASSLERAPAGRERPDFAAMTAGIGEYLTLRALGEGRPGALQPGAFELVDQALLERGSRRQGALRTGGQ